MKRMILACWENRKRRESKAEARSSGISSPVVVAPSFDIPLLEEEAHRDSFLGCSTTTEEEQQSHHRISSSSRRRRSKTISCISMEKQPKTNNISERIEGWIRDFQSQSDLRDSFLSAHAAALA